MRRLSLVIGVLSPLVIGATDYPPAPAHVHAGPIETEIKQIFEANCGKYGQYTVSLVISPSQEVRLEGISRDKTSFSSASMSQVNDQLVRMKNYKYSYVRCSEVGLNVVILSGQPSMANDLSAIQFIAMNGTIAGIRIPPIHQ